MAGLVWLPASGSQDRRPDPAALVRDAANPARSALPVAAVGVRNAHAMAYDERRGFTLLFGGADDAAVRGDTWSWDGERWQPVAAAGPQARTFPGFVWDAARGEAVLFGGKRVLFGRPDERDTFLGDTWVLRSNRWERRAGVGGPSPRAEAAMTYDATRGVVVLFGGYHGEGGATRRLGDTWEWNGSRWALREATGPAARSGAAMAWDGRLGRVVLFGGNGGPRSDSWTWDGRRWEPLATPDTPGRFNSVAAYDWARQQIVRTTGWDGRVRVSETWLLESGRWALKSIDGPAPRNHSAVAFDRRRGRLVLHGGHDGTLVFGDTWEWDGLSWTERARTSPRRRADNGH